MHRFRKTLGAALLLWGVSSSGLTAIANSGGQLRVASGIAMPANANVPFAIYKIVVDSGAGTIEQLGLVIPKTVRVSSGITAREGRDGKMMPLTVTQQGTMTILRFAQPLAPNSRVAIYLNGVRRIEGGGRVWTFPIYAQFANQPQMLQFDTATVTTYIP